MGSFFSVNDKSIIKKGGLVAPFFVIGALLCFLWASQSTEACFWWPGLCLISALFWLKKERLFALSWISCTLLGFCLLLLINALYLSPTYHANGLYFTATFLITFIAATRCPVWMTQTGFKLFCGLITFLGAWALLQWLDILDGNSGRAQTLFTTPNTLATALNLALVPLLGFYLLGHGRSSIYGLTLLLFAALLATQSRGGYLSLLAGIFFLIYFVGLANAALQWRRYRAVTIGFAAVIGFFKLYAWLGLANWSTDAVFDTLSHGDSSNRWEIYQVAWHGLAEHLLLGSGFFNFGYYFEAHKVPPFLDSHLIYVHNDYLQFAFELGLPGLGLFLLLLFVVYGQLFKFRQPALAGQSLPLILSAAAITSMLTHALVDFPFYIPLLQAVFGAYLGIINYQLLELGAAYRVLPNLPPQTISGFRPVFLGNLLLIIVMAWLSLPVLAGMSASYGLQRLQQGDAEHGVLWIGVARALQPRVTGYYWQEGVIWRDQGIAQARSDLLDKSATLFSKGFEVNAFDVKNLLEKTVMQRSYANRLKQPVSHEELMNWIQQAKILQPESYGVQTEYIQCLNFIGERAQALEQAQALVIRWPQSKAAQQLLASMAHE